MSALTITILKILLVAVILAAMIIILLGIGHIFSGNFHSTDDDTRQLRDEVNKESSVISNKSLFNGFISSSRSSRNTPKSTK